MIFTRKESRPATPFLEAEPCASGVEGCFHAGRSVSPPSRSYGHRAGGCRGGKAPFVNWGLTMPLLIFPLISLLILSFHLLSSPALAAGEEAPSFSWPARGEIVCPFRPAQGPYGSGGHAGIDISLSPGNEVRASAPGTVSFAGGTPLGPCVSIVHPGGLKTTYVSLGALAVRSGEKVSQGQVLGTSDGSKDRSSSSPHLHFGLFLNGKAIDPLPLLQGRFLDPKDCLFLGPWEDKAAVDAYFKRHNNGGFFGWVSRGLGTIGGAVSNACKGAVHVAGKALASAWRWTCGAARLVGRGFQEFYRHCIRPWFSPLCGGVAAAAEKLWSNRFVQALLAGLAAAAIICLAVAGIALVIGISAVTAVVTAVVGSVAAIGYAMYYAFTSGGSFSFTTCFLSSLAVGGAAAASSLLFSYMAPLIGAGWSNLGWLGFAKAFLIHGGVDSVIYIVFCLATGREVSPLGVLSSFLIGGLMGGVGKLFTAGLFSEGTVEVLAASWLSSGGALLSSEGTAGLTAYFYALTVNFAQKACYILYCGCTGFLADVTIRALTGLRPSLLESVLSFAGGALAGGLGLVGGGEGVSSLLARLSGGRLRLSGDFAQALAGKSLFKGLREGFSSLLRRLTGKKKRLDEGLWWSEIGGEY